METGPILYYVPEAACDPKSIVVGEDHSGGLQAVTTGKLNLEKLPSPLDERFGGFDRVPDDVIVSRCKGPDGQAGTCLFPKRPEDGKHIPCVSYASESQSWHVMGGGSYWMGWSNDHLPHPSWMERKPVQWNIEVGSLWKMAVCRSPDQDRVALPTVWSLDKKRRLIKRPAKEWTTYYDLSGKALGHLNGEQPLTDDQLMALAIELIGMNYRIGADEIWLAQEEAGVEWLRHEVIYAIVAVSCDWEKVLEHTFLEAEKKTEADAA